MKRIVTACAIAAALSAACASDRVLDGYLSGWQAQRDGDLATFVHRNFAFQREAAAERAKFAESAAAAPDLAPRWTAYASPTLATATRARTIFIDRGRADVLDPFLAHMRAEPGASATEEWFAAEDSTIREQAKLTGVRTSQIVSGFASPVRPGEAWSETIAALAAAQGTVRGRALALGELRRSAARYYRDVGYEKDSLGFFARPPEDTGGLVQYVERHVRWRDVRAALIAPRRCERGGGAVSCIAAASPTSGTGPAAESGALAPDPRSGKVPPSDESSADTIMPGNDMNRIPTTAPSTLDDLNWRQGW